jgi:hypothetical protein
LLATKGLSAAKLILLLARKKRSKRLTSNSMVDPLGNYLDVVGIQLKFGRHALQ